MKLYFAPMEGITSCIYRRLHEEMFPSADKYFSPFIAPNGDGSFKHAQLRELLPENNVGIRLVPQILCNSYEPFVVVAHKLSELGYDEVNLNAGCPSATVVSKHKGAGMLSDMDSLKRCLDGIFDFCPIRVSVKTRLGLLDTAEFPDILDIYKAYPLTELIIHARTREGMYRSEPDISAYKKAAENCSFPVCYNGNIFSTRQLERLTEADCRLDAVMLGRGAVANPALLRTLKGGEELKHEELESFHNTLLERMLDSGLDGHYALSHMKELWYYMRSMFPGSEREIKCINKSRCLSDYRNAVNTLFSCCDFLPFDGFSPPLS